MKLDLLLVSELTSNLTPGFSVLRWITSYLAISPREHLICSAAGHVRDERLVVINPTPTDQSDQSVLLENDITIHKRSHGTQSADHDRV